MVTPNYPLDPVGNYHFLNICFNDKKGHIIFQFLFGGWMQRMIGRHRITTLALY